MHDDETRPSGRYPPELRHPECFEAAGDYVRNVFGFSMAAKAHAAVLSNGKRALELLLQSLVEESLPPSLPSSAWLGMVPVETRKSLDAGCAAGLDFMKVGSLVEACEACDRVFANPGPFKRRFPQDEPGYRLIVSLTSELHDCLARFCRTFIKSNHLEGWRWPAKREENALGRFSDAQLMIGQEVAEYLGVTVASLTGWKSNRDPHPPVIITGFSRPRWRKSDVDAWLLDTGQPKPHQLKVLNRERLDARPPFPSRDVAIPDDDFLMVCAEMADYLHFSPITLRQWLCQGRRNPPYLRVGRLLRYRKRAVDNWLSSCTVRYCPEPTYRDLRRLLRDGDG